MVQAMKKPIVKWVVLPAVGTILKSLKQPDVAYTENIQPNSSKLAIFISKCFWRLECIPVSMIDKQRPSPVESKSVQAMT